MSHGATGRDDVCVRFAALRSRTLDIRSAIFSVPKWNEHDYVIHRNDVSDRTWVLRGAPNAAPPAGEQFCGACLKAFGDQSKRAEARLLLIVDPRIHRRWRLVDPPGERDLREPSRPQRSS